MAKQTITHACGHSEQHSLYGPGKERDRKAEWLETTLCYECYKAKQQADRAAASEQAAAAAQSSGLPALTGSEKQIAWAETLRKPVMEEVARLSASFATQSEKRDAHPVLRHWAEFAVWIAAQDTARWWIDHRALDVKETLSGHGGVAAIFALPITGQGGNATAKDHFRRFMQAQHPEVIAAQEAEAEAERLAEEQARADAEAAEQARKDALAGLLPESVNADNCAPVAGSPGWYLVVSPDGVPAEIEYHSGNERFGGSPAWCEVHRIGMEPTEYWRLHMPVVAAFAARCTTYLSGMIEAKASTFIALKAERGQHGSFSVTSTDGRIASGWIMDGEWAVSQIGEVHISSLHPEAERIGRDARALIEAPRN